ncbi:MAG: hypothetical protein NWS22_08985, partial [Porticoccaceae bacterium]|nr:hypothetical protein [Porticoccaceae bacterium]
KPLDGEFFHGSQLCTIFRGPAYVAEVGACEGGGGEGYSKKLIEVGRETIVAGTENNGSNTALFEKRQETLLDV